MKINIVEPIGFCPGVEKVLNRANEIITKYKADYIYFIGSVVHNDVIMNQLTSNKNVNILDGKDRLACLKQIKTKNNVIVFSAHGSDPQAIKYAQEQDWVVYDLTCSFVWLIFLAIRKSIAEGYHIAYFGDANHPEAIAAKAIGGNNLTIYKSKKDLTKVFKMNKVHIMCQSTMNYVEFEQTKSWFPLDIQIRFNNFVCPTSRARQIAAEDSRQYDIVFVLADKKSHNGESLYKTLSQVHKNVVFVTPDHLTIDKKLIENKKDCAIFSASSISKQQVNEFVENLKQLI